jgi:hypothetical protein
MWSNPTLRKLNAPKKLTHEEEALPKMKAFLDEYGLQITLKTLGDSLEKLMEKRGKHVVTLMVLEGIRGLHKGYLRRHEPEEDSDGH